jgi:hypothetical protein
VKHEARKDPSYHVDTKAAILAACGRLPTEACRSWIDYVLPTNK